MVSAEGERKVVTVLFADTANYTAMSEKLDPEEVHQIIDQCVKLLTDIVNRYGGTITQFTGDGIMALFGAPFAREDHAQRACHSALAIQQALEGYGAKIRQQYDVDFVMRIGINSGLAIVGSVGSDLHVEYTALGDTANLASRLEGRAPHGSVLVSKNTYEMAAPFFEFRSVGPMTVKGKAREVEAYELVRAGTRDVRNHRAGGAALTPFVGRKREAAILDRLYRRVESGSGQVVGIVGEAGVGKSRLLLQFVKTVNPGTWTCLEGQCLDYGASVAYLPLLDVVHSLFSIPDGESERAVKEKIGGRIRELSQGAEYIPPPLYELFNLPPQDGTYASLEPRQKRERTFQALKDLLVLESQKKNLLLIIEDLQWIDKTSEEFLGYLIASLVKRPILLVLLYRPEYQHPWGNKPFYTGISLDQLSLRARTEMIEGILGAPGISPALLDLVFQRTGGNPLFIEEFTRSLVQNGYVRRVSDRYTLSKNCEEIEVPDTVQGIIAARVDRLDRNVKRTMQIASVVGMDFSYAILDTVVGKTDEVKGHLSELEASEFIYEKNIFPDLTYVFKHALVHEVTYSSLLHQKKKEIHGRVGQAIEAMYPDRLEDFYEVLAHHYARSADSEKAYTYLKLAGLKAMQSYSLWEALHLFREAIKALDKAPDTDQRTREKIEIRLLSASPMISLGFPGDSLHILLEGERLARERAETKNLISFCSVIGLFHSIKGSPLTGVKYGEDCFRLAEQTGAVELLAPIAFDLCSNYAARGLFIKVVAMAPPILHILEEKHMQAECFDRGYNVYSALAAFCGFSKGYLGRFDEGRTFCDKALSVAEDSGNLYSLGLAELLYGYLFCAKGEGSEALSHFEKSVEYLERGHIFVLIGLAWSGLGWSNYYIGDLDAAKKYVEKGLQLHLEAGISYDLSVHYWFLSTICYERGELDRALDCAAEGIKLARKMDEMYVLGMSMIMRGKVLAAMDGLGNPAAENLLKQGLDLLENLKVRPFSAVGYLSLAEFYKDRKREAKAAHHLKVARAILQELGMEYWLKRAELLSNAD
jgi:class 3 adenylate cyclase/tetratricopeptide (TPR) repeat protein